MNIRTVCLLYTFKVTFMWFVKVNHRRQTEEKTKQRKQLAQVLPMKWVCLLIFRSIELFIEKDSIVCLGFFSLARELFSRKTLEFQLKQIVYAYTRTHMLKLTVFQSLLPVYVSMVCPRFTMKIFTSHLISYLLNIVWKFGHQKKVPESFTFSHLILLWKQWDSEEVCKRTRIDFRSYTPFFRQSAPICMLHGEHKSL